MAQQVEISPSRRDGITINSIVAPTVENGGLFSMDPSGILRGAKPNFKSVMSRRPRKCVKYDKKSRAAISPALSLFLPVLKPSRLVGNDGRRLSTASGLGRSARLRGRRLCGRRCGGREEAAQVAHPVISPLEDRFDLASLEF